MWLVLLLQLLLESKQQDDLGKLGAYRATEWGSQTSISPSGSTTATAIRRHYIKEKESWTTFQSLYGEPQKRASCFSLFRQS